jgi:hypothetical protein
MSCKNNTAFSKNVERSVKIMVWTLSGILVVERWDPQLLSYR